MIDLYTDVQRRIARLSLDDLREMASRTGLSFSMLDQIRRGAYPHSPTYRNLKMCAGYLSRGRKAA